MTTPPNRGGSYTPLNQPTGYDRGHQITELGNIARRVMPSVVRTITANAIQQPNDRYIFADTTNGNISVTLMNPISATPYPFTVENVNGVYTVTLVGVVEGVTNPTLSPTESLTIVSDGLYWRVPDAGVVTAGTGIAVDRSGYTTEITNTLRDATSEDILDLIAYAFRRISFLESALAVEYAKADQLIPPAYALIEEHATWT